MFGRLLISLFLLTSASAYKSYSNHQLWRLTVNNNNQLQKLIDFSRTAYKFDINFWSDEFRVDSPVDISIAPESMAKFQEFLATDDMQVKYDVIISDIGGMIEGQQLVHKLKPSTFTANDFAYDKYHTIEEIHAWIDQMVQAYPDLATSFVVGQSYEKRDLKGLKISSNKTAVKLDGTPVNKKKAIWWDGGIHAREWISPATNIFLAYSLLSNYSHSAEITKIVDQFDIYVLPVFNVDGYAYTWSNGKIK